MDMPEPLPQNPIPVPAQGAPTPGPEPAPGDFIPAPCRAQGCMHWRDGLCEILAVGEIVPDEDGMCQAFEPAQQQMLLPDAGPAAPDSMPMGPPMLPPEDEMLPPGPPGPVGGGGIRWGAPRY